MWRAQNRLDASIDGSLGGRATFVTARRSSLHGRPEYVGVHCLSLWGDRDNLYRARWSLIDDQPEDGSKYERP